jgi:Alpha/beta hydrolase family
MTLSSQAAGEEKPPLFIHLLHGTWASGAPWTQPNSLLAQSLKKEFGDPLPVNWTGTNRDRDRRSAAEQVVAALENQQGRHVLNSHSHGGNVAIYAAADPRLGGKIAGIVCLNTPFISIVRRDCTTRLAILAVVAVISPILWVAGNFVERIESLLIQGLIVLFTGILIALSLSSSVPLLRYLYKEGLKIWNRLAPSRVGVPVLCISTGDDEAEYGLSLFEHIANLPTFLMHPYVMLVLFFGGVGIQAAGLVPELSLLGFKSGLVFGAFMNVLLIFLFLQLIAVVLSFVTGRIGLGLGFDYWPLLYNFFVRVRVTPVPLNYRPVDFIDFEVPVAKGLSNLAHSRVYEDEKIIQQILSWLNNGFALEPKKDGAA